MAALENVDRLQWVNFGLTVVPIADVLANEGLRRTLSAAVGQLRTITVPGPISWKQPSA